MNRSFARLWTAAFCSETGEWMLQVALPVLVYQSTGSAASTAAMMIVGMVPAVVLSPVAGVLADRADRRLLLLLVCLGQAVVALPLLVVDGAGWYLVMAAQAALAAVFEPARTALVPALVAPERVTAANGMLASAGNVARLAGAWLGGLLFALGGIGLVVGGYVVVLLAAAGALVVPFGDRGRAPADRRPAVREWLDGLNLIRRNRRLWVVGAAMVLMAAAQGMFLVLFVPFVLDVLRAGPEGVGLLRGVQAVGGLLAGLGIAVLARRVSPTQMYGWGAVTFGVVSAVGWHAHGFGAGLGVYVGLFVLVGVPSVVAATGLVSTLQRAVPPAAVGRLTSTAFAAIALGTAAGMLIAGWTATWPPILDVQAAGYLVGGALVLIGENGR
ncbi:MFS transporter [Actinophytocola gossypii]|uniref:MFS transporter n=1 Tax=Actinophytocola gossypii TaxID=2812003 RepID=A0ABT2JH52_9PSEU|nr:MFS transporter [Actinophytocola gossypii]MCT2587212.1 MFS transporter [Actinophytocola gossypii]